MEELPLAFFVSSIVTVTFGASIILIAAQLWLQLIHAENRA